MSLELTLKIINSLTCFNLFIIYLEYLGLVQLFDENGIYNSKTLSREFNENLIGKTVLKLSKRNILRTILVIALILILINLFYPHPIFLLFFILINFFFSFKTEGAFNGGSDYMTILTLITLFLSYTFKSINIFVLYLALQLILSYFLAGLVKVKNQSWRKGIAVGELFSGPNYAPPSFIKRFFSIPKISFVLSWSVIIIELIFPLMFTTKQIWILFLFGAVFHFLNFICFGLNRFFWSWIATYPSLIYLFTILPSIK